MKEIIDNMVRVKKICGPVKVQAYFTKDGVYFRTQPGYVRVESWMRRHLRKKAIRVNDVLFPWGCSFEHAESILGMNASLKAADGEIEYLNDKPITFFCAGSGKKAFRTISGACVRALVECNGELERMVTNSCEPDTNMVGYAIPVLRSAHLYTMPGKEGRVGIEGFSEGDIKKILVQAQKLRKSRTLSLYTQEWLEDIFIPALTGYLAGLKMPGNDFDAVYKAYCQKVEEVNRLLKEHESEFDFSDEKFFQFDCGFMTIGFTDPYLSKQRMVLINNERTRYKTPAIQLPKMVQSLAVQCREFEKAKRIVKRELGLDIAILESHLD